MIWKIKFLALSLIMNLKFFLINIFSSKKNVDDNARVIVSLTCFPARIDKVYLTIESVMAQITNARYEVRLYLSEDEFTNKILPLSLQRLQRRNVKIIFVKNNIRSYKKLHYAYANSNGLPVITIDDDIFYPPCWLEEMYACHKINKNEIVYMRGREISFESDGLTLKNYNDFSLTSSSAPSFTTIPTGVSGILYPANSLYKDWNNERLFLSLCPTADDIWYKFMSLLNGRSCILANNQASHYIPVLGTQAVSLRKHNVSSGFSKNDEQLQHLIKYYDVSLSEYK